MKGKKKLTPPDLKLVARSDAQELEEEKAVSMDVELAEEEEGQESEQEEKREIRDQIEARKNRINMELKVLKIWSQVSEQEMIRADQKLRRVIAPAG
jgi:hypothetical protein